MSQRLTRKDIKEDIRHDGFVTTVEQSIDYIQAHARTLGIALAALVAVVLAAVGVNLYLGHRATEANAALAEAMEAASAPIVSEGTEEGTDADLTFPSEEARRQRARELFEGVKAEYGATEAGSVATLYLANMALEEGDVEGARRTWEAFLDDHGDHILAAEVRLNLLSLKRAQGDPEGVAETLRAMLDEEDLPLPPDVILFELASTLEDLAQTDEAVGYYQRIVDEYPKSPYGNEAKRKAEELGRKG